jgi:hypothetical protein
MNVLVTHVNILTHQRHLKLFAPWWSDQVLEVKLKCKKDFFPWVKVQICMYVGGAGHCAFQWTIELQTSLSM